jgi:hypothetical protein
MQSGNPGGVINSGEAGDLSGDDSGRVRASTGNLGDPRAVQQPHREVYQPKTALVWTITALMTSFVLCALAMAGATLYQHGLLKQIQAGQDVPQEQLELSDAMVGAPACVYVLVLLALAITWCIWKAGCNRNARAISGKDLEYTPGWCAGAYFVPIANLVWPYQAMKEIWENSDPQASTAIVGWWWGLWILNNVVSNIATRITFRAETVDELITASTLDLAVAPLDVISAAVALLLVWKLHWLQQGAAEDPSETHGRLSAGTEYSY